MRRIKGGRYGAASQRKFALRAIILCVSRKSRKCSPKIRDFRANGIPAGVCTDFSTRVLSLDSFITAGRKACADALEELNQHYKEHNGKNHYKIFISVIAVVNGYFAESAAADNTAHCGVPENGCYCKRGVGYK